jgi:hypothetical protein
VLLGSASDSADLVNERDALGQRVGPEVGRDQVVEATPVLDTVGRVELPGRDLLGHASEPNSRGAMDARALARRDGPHAIDPNSTIMRRCDGRGRPRRHIQIRVKNTQ